MFNAAPTGRYDDVDSAEDIPTAHYYEQLLHAYPTAKFVLTVRGERNWLARFACHRIRF